jgi:hypothetical protein
MVKKPKKNNNITRPENPTCQLLPTSHTRKVKTEWERQENRKEMVEDRSGERVLCEKVVCEKVYTMCLKKYV